jgi:hypothetical protein
MRTPGSHRLSFAVVAMFFGCQTVSASDFKTSEITANMSATSTGDGTTTVNATFRKGAISLTFIELTSDDTLTATSGQTTKTLSETSLLGLVTYSANLPVDGEGTQFIVSLARKKDSGAPSSVATLPTAFTLEPVSGTFSRADAGPTFNWSPGGTDTMTLSISGDCIDTYATTLPDSATTYALSAGVLHKRTNPDGGTAVGDNCDATATLDRTKNGTLDSAFAGGSMQGVQRRTATFGTAP